jgi:hypothetical protein
MENGFIGIRLFYCLIVRESSEEYQASFFMSPTVVLWGHIGLFVQGGLKFQ